MYILFSISYLNKAEKNPKGRRVTKPWSDQAIPFYFGAAGPGDFLTLFCHMNLQDDFYRLKIGITYSDRNTYFF